MKKNQITIYPGYFTHYLSLIEENELLPAMERSLPDAGQFLASIPEEKMEFAYAAEKWNIKKLLMHLIDSERIFAYRALCIARGEKTKLPGFDEHDYAAASVENHLTGKEIIAQYLLNRENTLLLFKSFSPHVYKNIGNASGFDIELGALGYGILGHEKHHFNILQERYL